MKTTDYPACVACERDIQPPSTLEGEASAAALVHHEFPAHFARARALYDQNRYRDAWKFVAPFWQAAPVSAEDLPDWQAFCARLALRLGSSRRSALLVSLVSRAFPRHPAVLALNPLAQGCRSIFDALRQSEAPHPPDLELPRSSSYLECSQAYLWGRVHDVERAREHLLRASRALELGWWIQTLEAELLLLDARAEDALLLLKAAWNACPGHPTTARLLASCLKLLEGIPAAAAWLRSAVETSQSYELEQLAVAFTLAEVERLPHAAPPGASTPAEELEPGIKTEGPPQKAELLEWAEQLLTRLRERTPLRDGHFHRTVRGLELDLAVLSGQTERARRLQARQGLTGFVIPEQAEDAEDVLLHRPVFQQGAGCLPAAVATVLSAAPVKPQLEPLIAPSSHYGTTLSGLKSWCQSQNLLFRPFLLTRTTARSLIDARLPFVVLLTQSTSGHAVAAIGYDAARDALIIHDPAHTRRARLPLASIDTLEAPFGARAVFVGAESCGETLNRILPLENPSLQSLLELERLVEKQELATARAKLQELLSHPGLQPELSAQLVRFDARLLALEEQPQKAVDRLLSLGADEKTPQLRLELLHLVTLPGLRIPALEALTASVPPTAGERVGPDPGGLELQLQVEMARALLYHPQGLGEAEAMLHAVLVRDETHLQAWLALADVCTRDRRPEDSRLCLRVAAQLQPTDNELALRYIQALRCTRLEDCVIPWLSARYERLRGTGAESSAGILLAIQLDDSGRAMESKQLLDSLLKSHPEDALVLVEAVRLSARRGIYDAAHASLSKLRALNRPREAALAALYLAQWTGDFTEHRIAREGFCQAAPDSMDCLMPLFRQLVEEHGWHQAQTELRQFARVHSTQATRDKLELTWQLDGKSALCQLPALKAHLSSYPSDAIALRQLVLNQLEVLEHLPGPPSAEKVDEIRTLLRRLSSLQVDEAELDLQEARLLLLLGDEARAEQLLTAIAARRPGFLQASQLLFGIGQHSPEERRSQLKGRLLQALEAHRLTPLCLQEVLCLARPLLGPHSSLELLEFWYDGRVDNPEAFECYLDARLDLADDAAPLAPLLEAGEKLLRRFPWHDGLRQSVAQLMRRLGQLERALELWTDKCQRQPRSALGHFLRMEILLELGRTEDAEVVLKKALEHSPWHLPLWQRRLELQVRTGREEEGRRQLTAALRTRPDWLEMRLVQLELEHRTKGPEGVTTALTACLTWFNDNSEALLTLARWLIRRGIRAMSQIQTLLERALALDGESTEALHLLAALHLNENPGLALALLDEHERLVSQTLGLQDFRQEVITTLRPDHSTLTALVSRARACPRDPSGWKRLFERIEQQKAWKTARDVVEPLEPHRIPTLELQISRLLLLEQAGLPAARLEKIWTDQLALFPEEGRIWALRALQLFKQHRDSDALAALKMLASIQPAHRLLQLEKLQTALHRRDWVRATEAAGALAELDQGVPVGAVHLGWKRAVEACPLDRLVDTVIGHFRNGVVVDHEALDTLAEALRERRAGHELQRLLLNASGTVAASYAQGLCLHSLVSIDQPGLASGWIDAHRAELKADNRLWEAVGVVYFSLERWEDAGAWLSDWNQRQPDLETFNIYVSSRLRTGKTDGLLEECLLAQQRLQPDNTAPFLAYAILRLSLSQKRDEVFVQKAPRALELMGQEAQMAPRTAFYATCLALLQPNQTDRWGTRARLFELSWRMQNVRQLIGWRLDLWAALALGAVYFVARGLKRGGKVL